MKQKFSLKVGVVGAVVILALGGAFLAGRYWAVESVPLMELEKVKMTTPEEAPLAVPVPVPVAIPFALEVRGRAPEPASPALPGIAAEPTVEVDPDLCVQHTLEGGRVVWIRTKDGTGITKYDFAPDGALSFLTDMKVDAKGNPLGAKVYDAQHQLIYKTSYGYHRKTGALAAELIFDNRLVLDANQKRVSIRRVNYSTDANGAEVATEEPRENALAENAEEPEVLPAPFTAHAFPGE